MSTEPAHTGTIHLSDQAYIRLEAETSTSGSQVFLRSHEARQAHRPLRMTPFGRQAPSLMDLFSVQSAVLDACLEELAPRCDTCGGLTHKPQQLEDVSLPTDGFLAAVLCDEGSSLPVRERCELLGVERVLSNSRIVRAEDLKDDEGEPVLVLVSADHAVDLRAGISLWHNRGSEAIRVVHLKDRTAEAREIACLRATWSCERCNKQIPPASKLSLTSCVPCSQCRGEGWLDRGEGRLQECDDCRGFGSSDSMSRHEWAGTQLRYVAALSFKEVRDRLHVPGALLQALDAIIAHRFGGHPIGMPISFLSGAERAQATMLVAELSRLTTLTFVADGGALWSEGDAPPQPSLQACYPHASPGKPLQCVRDVDTSIVIRGIERGPLSISELRIPVGGSLVVQGDPGTGKRILLGEVAALFARRKRAASSCVFPGMRTCTLIDPFASAEPLVSDLLGVSKFVAEDLARTRSARERGMTAPDFQAATSRYRCGACLDGVSEETCRVCAGSGVNSTVGDVVFGAMSYAEILRAPLATVAGMLWSSEVLHEIVRELPDDLSQTVSLSTRAARLTSPHRRALSLIGGLARVAAAKKGRQRAPLMTELVLVHAPCSVAAEHQRLVWRLLGELNDRGATIVCARVPQTLESCFGSVLRLRPAALVGAARSARMRHAMYDVRMTRAADVEVVK